MLIEEECIPCILNMTLNGLKTTLKEKRVYRYVFHEIVKRVMGHEEIWNFTSAEIVEKALNLLCELTSITDPFYTLKRETNLKLMRYYSTLWEILDSESDPVFLAFKLAIIGNVIDTMVQTDYGCIVQDIVLKAKTLRVNEKKYKTLIQKISTANKILYIGDNSAEAILDMAFIEVLKRNYSLDVTYVVRNEPVLNDVTIDDAIEIGLNRIATVITNGIKGPLPGVILKRCSEEFFRHFDGSDLVIVKGGGNVETLSEELSLNERVFFLLMCKCRVHERFLEVPLGEAVIWNGPFPNSQAPTR